MIQIIGENGSSSGPSVSVSNYIGSDAVKKEYITGAIINGGKAVFVDTDTLLYPYDITDPSTYGRCIGIAEQSAILGDTCSVVTSGKSNFIGSGWLPGVLYYISSTGFLSTTPPVIGWCQPVAVGIDNDTISIDLQLGIELI